jgi:hypothetical protein
MRVFTDKQVNKILGLLLNITDDAEKVAEVYKDPAIDQKDTVRKMKRIVESVKDIVAVTQEGEEVTLQVKKP